MSYDLYIDNKQTGEHVRLPEKHEFTGGTFALGGTDYAWLNVTYNYSGHFRDALGGDGLNDFAGKNVRDTLQKLRDGIAFLGDAEPSDDYWEACAGNAKRALQNLLSLAELTIDVYPDLDLVWYIC